MELICKNNNDITKQELEILFSMYLYNSNKIAQGKRHFNKANNSTEYKENWINGLLKNDKNKYLICVENGNLIGFTIVSLEEKENYINDFQIIESYQHDGRTFRFLVEALLNNSNPDNDFKGRIWSENDNAKIVFKSMGALIVDGKYQLSYKKAKEWFEKGPQEYNGGRR